MKATGKRIRGWSRLWGILIKVVFLIAAFALCYFAAYEVITERQGFHYKGYFIKSPHCITLKPTSVDHVAVGIGANTEMTLLFAEGEVYRVIGFIDPAKAEGIYVIGSLEGSFIAGPFTECPLSNK